MSDESRATEKLADAIEHLAEEIKDLRNDWLKVSVLINKLPVNYDRGRI